MLQLISHTNLFLGNVVDFSLNQAQETYIFLLPFPCCDLLSILWVSILTCNAIPSVGKVTEVQHVDSKKKLALNAFYVGIEDLETLFFFLGGLWCLESDRAFLLGDVGTALSLGGKTGVGITCLPKESVLSD